MIVSLPSRGIGAAALAAALLLAGCSSDSDVPQTVVSAPGGGTQINTDTGSGGNFPDINTVPTQRPTSTIQNLDEAGNLSGAPGGTPSGAPAVGAPGYPVAPPGPLAPIPESGVQTQQSNAAPANTDPSAQAVTPQPASRPLQPGTQLASASGSVQTQSLSDAPQQAQLPTGALGPNYQALAPERYGVSFPQPVLPPYQPYNPAQAMYRSPYTNPPTNYGGLSAPVDAAPSAVVVPNVVSYGQPSYDGQPVGLIYFRDGSSRLSSDDRQVLKQIAEMQRAKGGMIKVVGHASMRTRTMDYVRHQQANQRISESRAKAVARQLAKYGVPQSSIQTSAVGASQPLYAEVMPSGEAANRRAEVYLTAY